MSALIHPEESVCIFVFPASLTFYLDDPSTHKRILTIHNPYGRQLRFRVLCTDTNKYTVSESQGHIKPLNAQDLVVRHKAVLPENIGISDTIRVQLFSSRQSLGMKEISVTLQANKPPEPATSLAYAAAAVDAERFQQLNSEASLTGSLRQRPIVRQEEHFFSRHFRQKKIFFRHSQKEAVKSERNCFNKQEKIQKKKNGSVSKVAHLIVSVVVAMCCIVILNLPSEEKIDDRLPFYLHLSQTVRLIAAYILGCVTTLFLRS